MIYDRRSFATSSFGLLNQVQVGSAWTNGFKVTGSGEFPTSMRLELREGRGTSLDETHGTSLKCQTINIPFTQYTQYQEHATKGRSLLTSHIRMLTHGRHAGLRLLQMNSRRAHSPVVDLDRVFRPPFDRDATSTAARPQVTAEPRTRCNASHRLRPQPCPLPIPHTPCRATRSS